MNQRPNIKILESLEVLQSGAFTTIQDLGRYGYQKYGVSISGAMDRFALRIANLLVGNEEGEAAIEVTIVGPQLKALKNLGVAFTGADLSPEINGIPAPMWCTVPVQEGETISFGPPKTGCRAYLAVAGGIDIPSVMGSRSIHTRSNLGWKGRALIKGDVIKAGRVEKSWAPANPTYRWPADQIPIYGRDWQVRAVLGPQNDYFTRRGIQTFLSSEYTITPQSDRMGYRLKGPAVEHKSGADILTDATPPG